MNKEKKKIFILDTSAILSGKQLNFEGAELITTTKIEEEIKPGGRDYKNFLYLKEKCLIFKIPSNDSLGKIMEISKKTGDIDRLSLFDIEILAIAFDENKEKDVEVVILTDDYSIQNIATIIKIKYISINQKGITKKFKWNNRCRGCGKKFKSNIRICPICGSHTKKIVIKKEEIDE